MNVKEQDKKGKNDLKLCVQSLGIKQIHSSRIRTFDKCLRQCGRIKTCSVMLQLNNF